MTGEHAGFTDIPPLRRNRSRLPGRAGVLRLVFIVCAIFGAAQLIVPLIARLALNGGQVWPTDEVHSLWGAVLPYPVLSIPAWLTIATGLVGMTAAGWYLLDRGDRSGSDAAYVSIVSLVSFGMIPWAIAALDADPTGIIHTPGPDSYPIGWHWVATPLSLVVVAIGIVESVLSSRAQEQRRRTARARIKARARGELGGHASGDPGRGAAGGESS